MYLHPVEHDNAIRNVLWSRRSDLNLVRQFKEVFIVNEENEDISLQVIVQGKLPGQFIIHELEREQT